MRLTLIRAFEVAPEADDAFLAGWERARDWLLGREGFGLTAVLRALRPDAAFRFVEVAGVDSAETWDEVLADPAFPGAQLPFEAHQGVYDVVHEDGTPDDDGGVDLIDPFEVPADADADFLAGWDRGRDLLAAQPGYLGTRLHRSVGATGFRFVNLARWSSPLAFAKAVEHPGFRSVTGAMPFASHPSLYQVVETG